MRDSFPGFVVSGYRSFGADPQVLGPLGRVNLVVGPNNTGKSNFLSLFHRHAQNIQGAIEGGQGSKTLDPSLDPHSVGDAEPPPFQIGWPIDTETVETHAPQLHEFLALEEFTRSTSVAWLPFDAVSVTGALGVSEPWLQQVASSSDPGVWQRLSGHLTSTEGGSPLDDHRRVMNWVRTSALVPMPPTKFIPAHRQIRAGQGTEDWDLGGTGLVARLDTLKNAGFLQREEKRAYQAIRDGMRELLGVSTCDYNVPRGADTIELIVDGQHRPLDSFGTGYEHALLIVAATVAFPDHFFCIEEPEIHLHPRLQRQLAEHLRDRTQSQLLISTHSATLIDALREQVFRTDMHVGSNATYVTLPVDADNVAMLDDLGYRASDLLQTNCVVWVEGPSDRVYINAWLHGLAGDDAPVEGADYLIMFYGGALLDRASAAAEGEFDADRVPLRRLQQHFAVVADSDKRDAATALKQRVLRVEAEVEQNPTGLTWITAGRSIESYVDRQVLAEAVRVVHPTVSELLAAPTPESDPLVAVKADGSALVTLDKVAIAERVVETPVDLSVLDLEDRVGELLEFIRRAND